jgi:hypothetical protein
VECRPISSRSDAKPQADTSAKRIEIVRSFLKRFDHFRAQEEQSLPLIGRFLKRFTIRLGTLREEEESWRRATAPDFNVFRMLRLERRETKLHSRFLAELLDPNGLHGQENLFLSEFLELAQKSGLQCPPGLPADLIWKVTTEEAVNAHDRLDIVLRGSPRGYLGDRFVMVVENKVDAAEGSEQLSRYYKDWLQNQQANFRNLVFLTVDGREPKTISKDKCLCLSYREHITGWLRKVLDRIQAKRLQFAIEQYLEVLNSL